MIDTPRLTTGGGVAIIYRSSIDVSRYQLPSFGSFELIGAKIRVENRHVLIFTLYRPPPSAKNGLTFNTFLTEFTQLLELLAVVKTPFIIFGDFNVHVDNAPVNCDARKFLDLLDSFGIVQLVSSPTHSAGHTLDLILTNSNTDLVSNVITQDYGFPGHYPVFSSLSIPRTPHNARSITYRSIKHVNIGKFRADICDALRSTSLPTQTRDVDDMVQVLMHQLKNTLDTHAPLKTRFVPTRINADWYDDNIRDAKQIRRRLERRWRSTKIEIDRQIYRNQCDVVIRLIKDAKQKFYNSLISENGNDSRSLFRVIDALMGKSRISPLPSGLSTAKVAEDLGNFFHDKVCKISTHLQLDNSNNQLDTQRTISSSALCWPTFPPTTVDEVTKIVSRSPEKSCTLDPIPTGLFKACISELAPVLADILNTSLHTGVFPSSFKNALVSPILKKPSLDANVLGNYRPVSNLLFLSKVLEKIVVTRLNAHLQRNGLLEPLQSAYREFHSTETALLKIKDDIAISIGNRKAVLLILLDLSAAFDTINHQKLIDTLQDLGLSGSVINWFTSYLTNRHQSIVCAGSTSHPFELKTGVPQGSVLGPVLFTIYTSSLGLVLRNLGVNYHFYADDTQLYLSFNPKCESNTISTMANCVDAVKKWMIAHHLMMNDNKTEAMVFGNKHTLSQLVQDRFNFSDQSVPLSTHARSLGFTLDQQLLMCDQVNNQCRLAYLHIKNLARIKPFLTAGSLETVVHAFITSRLDYSNSLYLGAPQSVINKLQGVQNSAARLINDHWQSEE